MNKNRFWSMMVGCLAIALGAQSCVDDDSSGVIVPEVAASKDCTSDDIFEEEQTVQVLIPEAEVGRLSVGDQITGMAMRLTSSAEAAYPVAAGGFDQFVVKLGRGPQSEVLSNTFASNFVGEAVTVHTGPRFFDKESFSSGSAPNAFGPKIPFNAAAFTYEGGPLVIEIRSSDPDEDLDVDACDTVSDESNGKSIYATGEGAATAMEAEFPFGQAMVIKLFIN